MLSQGKIGRGSTPEGRKGYEEINPRPVGSFGVMGSLEAGDEGQESRERKREKRKQEGEKDGVGWKEGRWKVVKERQDVAEDGGQEEKSRLRRCRRELESGASEGQSTSGGSRW